MSRVLHQRLGKLLRARTHVAASGRALRRRKSQRPRQRELAKPQVAEGKDEASACESSEGAKSVLGVGLTCAKLGDGRTAAVSLVGIFVFVSLFTLPVVFTGTVIYVVYTFAHAILLVHFRKKEPVLRWILICNLARCETLREIFFFLFQKLRIDVDSPCAIRSRCWREIVKQEVNTASAASGPICEATLLG
jgi:hypothetical protein